MTTGLSPRREALFVPGCWPVYRRLFVSVNSFHARHVRECKPTEEQNQRSIPLDPRLISGLSPGPQALFLPGCRGGARRGGRAGRGWVGRDAFGSIWPGDYPPSSPPANREHCPCGNSSNFEPIRTDWIVNRLGWVPTPENLLSAVSIACCYS